MSISRKLKNAASGTADGGGSGTYVDDVFSTYLWEADGTDQTIQNGIDLTGEGGLVWIKSRSTTASNLLYDTERGVRDDPAGWALRSNTTDKQYADESLKGFNSDGFLTGPLTAQYHGSMASWTFGKAKNFFDVVTYTGNSTDWGDLEVPHNLGSVPGAVFIKRVDSPSDWWCVMRKNATAYASATNGTSTPFGLNTTNAANGAADIVTRATSTTFKPGAMAQTPNAAVNGGTYVAYLFAHDDSDESMIKCGSYGPHPSWPTSPEIDLGFEPQWVMIKRVDGTGNWTIVDSMRGANAGGDDAGIRPNTPEEEFDTPILEITPSGFKVTGSNADYNNPSPAEYIYMAIRRPNKPAEEFEPDELFAVDNSDTSNTPRHQTSFVVDMGINKNVTSVSDIGIASRLTGQRWLNTAEGWAEQDGGDDWMTWDYMDGWNGFTSASNTGWSWRRAPGFMDVVAYEGNGVAGREVKHNLSVPPEMIWLKTRTFNDNWVVWNKYLSDPLTKYLSLNNDFQESNQSSTPQFGGAMPTDSFFKVGTDPGSNNASSTYIAYLFASVPGISKVGSYTGNGSEVEVDCGFTNGARWVLIKKTNSSGDWYFTSNPSNFKILSKLNTTDAQVNYQATFNDVPSGFRVTGIGDLNDNGDEYIYYAIA